MLWKSILVNAWGQGQHLACSICTKESKNMSGKHTTVKIKHFLGPRKWEKYNWYRPVAHLVWQA